jgi:hypothetical protein
MKKQEIKRQDLTPEQVIEFGLTPEVIEAYNDYLTVMDSWKKIIVNKGYLNEDLFGECISPIIDIKK